MNKTMYYINNKNSNIDLLNERAFLIAVFLSVATYVFHFSSVESYPTIKILILVLRLITYSLIGIKFFIDFFCKKYNKYLFLIFLLSLYVTFVSYRSKTIGYFVYFAFIIVGHNVDYLKIIKITFFSICFNVSLILLFCFAGIIPNLIYQNGNRVRQSLGFGYPPLLSNYVFYATLCYLYIKKNKITIPIYIYILIINTFIFLKTDTKSAFCLSLISIFLFIIISNLKMNYNIRNLFYKFIFFLPTISALFAILISYFYIPNNIIFSKLNSLLTGRLSLANRAFNDYGVKWFGQHIVFHGYESSNGLYNIIDSSFVLYLIILGIIFLVLLVAFLTYFAKLISKKDDIYLAIIFMIILLHSIFDAQLFQISYNYFMFIISYSNYKMEYKYE